jgi:hypothetical protein
MEFETLREKRDADPAWTLYRSKISGMIVNQEDKLMVGANFSPVK